MEFLTWLVGLLSGLWFRLNGLDSIRPGMVVMMYLFMVSHFIFNY